MSPGRRQRRARPAPAAESRRGPRGRSGRAASSGGGGASRVLEIGIWGCGRAGSAFARAIGRRRGRVRVASVLSRSRRKAAALSGDLPGVSVSRGPADLAARCDAILLCVPDGALSSAASRLAAEGSLKGLSILHVSGALDLGVLEPARRAGASVGSLHPLAPLASGGLGADLLQGAWFAPAGRGGALAAARSIAAHLGGSLLRVPVRSRPAYHLAATIIANHSTILSALALERLGREGLRGPRVREAFASLLRAAARSMEEMGPLRALTGPASRADLGTLQRHLELLRDDRDGLAALYLLLTGAGLDLSVRRGDLPPERASQVKRSLRGPGKAR